MGINLNTDVFTFPQTDIKVKRVGYGAMQLAGPHVWGPPKDKDAAIAVLREAVALGVDHIDTADFYGPHVTNEIIREALQPYQDTLTIVTKVGAKRGRDKSWNKAVSADDLTAAVHDNLRNLGKDVLDVVNLRLMTSQDAVAEPLRVIADLQNQGLIRAIGLSNVTLEQVRQAQSVTDIVCVQNEYNLAKRGDDALIDVLAAQNIAYVPFFPLGGFTPLQSAALDDAAASVGASPMQVALAWLLQRSPNILLIPGTSSVAHLRENMLANRLTLPPALVTRLDAIAGTAKAAA